MWLAFYRGLAHVADVEGVGNLHALGSRRVGRATYSVGDWRP